jgi:hypothetical protein
MPADHAQTVIWKNVKQLFACQTILRRGRLHKEIFLAPVSVARSHVGQVSCRHRRMLYVSLAPFFPRDPSNTCDVSE